MNVEKNLTDVIDNEVVEETIQVNHQVERKQYVAPKITCFVVDESTEGASEIANESTNGYYSS